METATISTRTLEINGMTGDACVQKVTGALKGVPNVSTKSVKVGGATIGADQAGCDAACAAVGTAGYKTHENKAGATKPDGACTAPAAAGAAQVGSTGKTPAEHKAANMARTAEQAEACAAADASKAATPHGTPASNAEPKPAPTPVVAMK